ncbi:outer membrane beta-barrel protein [Microbulbifer sp. SAOS-129_SWC]|uniref:outer membrane protein n=1 Tax=Microbulbifer sp. SAOS-129_SWC TaxID=3145235 RepID=UPI003216E0D0
MARPLFLLAVPLLTLCTQAQADFYSHRYAGVSISDATLQGFCSGAEAFVQGISASNSTCSSGGDGWKVYGGWRWSPLLAVELSYQQLPTSSLDFRVNGDRDDYIRAQDEIKTRLANAFVVGHWPLGSGFSLFGKAGGGIWLAEFTERQSGQLYARYLQQDGTVNEVLVSVNGKAADNDSGFQWGYGAGISYRYHNSWTLRAEWESFSDVGSDKFRSSFDVQTASLGWSMHF